MQTWQAFWSDESGVILSAELVLILTIAVLGIITGLACVRTAVVEELVSLGAAFRSLNQSYFVTGFSGCGKWGCGRLSWTSGSFYVDRPYVYQAADICFAGDGMASGPSVYSSETIQRTDVLPSAAPAAVITTEPVPNACPPVISSPVVTSPGLPVGNPPELVCPSPVGPGLAPMPTPLMSPIPSTRPFPTGPSAGPANQILPQE